MPPDDTTPPDDAPRPERGGRPTKFTPELQAAFIRQLEEGMFRNVACRVLGVGVSTFTRWMAAGKRYPGGAYGAFRREVDAAEARGEAFALGQVLRAPGSRQEHYQWFLERKYPHRWGKTRGELVEVKARLKELEKLMGELRDEAPARRGDDQD